MSFYIPEKLRRLRKRRPINLSLWVPCARGRTKKLLGLPRTEQLPHINVHIEYYEAGENLLVKGEIINEEDRIPINLGKASEFSYEILEEKVIEVLGINYPFALRTVEKKGYEA